MLLRNFQPAKKKLKDSTQKKSEIRIGSVRARKKIEKQQELNLDKVNQNSKKRWQKLIFAVIDLAKCVILARKYIPTEIKARP